MATESEHYRQRAQEQRDEAAKTTLPNARGRALHAAERWDVMADQLERSSAAAIKREADKADRDARRVSHD
jgi:hypothetical protein